MNTTPIILVPGFWLGAWEWDEVAAVLRADGHDVTADEERTSADCVSPSGFRATRMER